MKMLRWTCGVTKMDRVRNEHIRGSIKVTELSKKMQERRLQWFGHVMRRDDEHVGKKVMDMHVVGQRRVGRPKLRWKDRLKEDLKEKGLTENDTQDRRRWKKLARNSDPI